MVRALFRFISSATPTLDDFARACELAPGLGFGWIATIALEDSAGYEVSQYGRDRHHYTIFGEPEQLMALVSEVRPVPRASGE